MSPVEHVVIAAAGIGSRLGLGQPKCLVEVAGVPIIGHQLALLDDVKDVRIVIGFEEQAVIDTALKFRKDIVFVRNPAYRTTSTAVSYALGGRHLRRPAVYLDGDIIFERASLSKFMSCAGKTEQDVLIGITETKTVDAVSAHLDDDGRLVAFSRETPAEYEWANIVCAPPDFFEGSGGAVYERLQDVLPTQPCRIESYEVDRVEDLKRAEAFLATRLQSAD